MVCNWQTYSSNSSLNSLQGISIFMHMTSRLPTFVYFSDVPCTGVYVPPSKLTLPRNPARARVLIHEISHCRLVSLISHQPSPIRPLFARPALSIIPLSQNHAQITIAAPSIIISPIVNFADIKVNVNQPAIGQMYHCDCSFIHEIKRVLSNYLQRKQVHVFELRSYLNARSKDLIK